MPILSCDEHDLHNCYRAGKGQASAAGSASNEDELRRLRDENEALKEALASLAASCIPDELREGE